jgi:hypothetical protein
LVSLDFVHAAASPLSGYAARQIAAIEKSAAHRDYDDKKQGRFSSQQIIPAIDGETFGHEGSPY